MDAAVWSYVAMAIVIVVFDFHLKLLLYSEAREALVVRGKLAWVWWIRWCWGIHILINSNYSHLSLRRRRREDCPVAAFSCVFEHGSDLIDISQRVLFDSLWLSGEYLLRNLIELLLLLYVRNVFSGNSLYPTLYLDLLTRSRRRIRRNDRIWHWLC